MVQGLRVVYFATYLTRGTLGPEDWNALKFIKAIKGDEINGYARVPLPVGIRPKLEQSNAHRAPKWFGLMAADYIDAEDWSDKKPYVLVPVPNRLATVGSEAPSRTARLAEAIASEVHETSPDVLDVLRWREERPSARSGAGTRERDEICGNLELVGSKAERTALEHNLIILVDDVMTKGGHLLGCADFLEGVGGEILIALVAGRTVHEPPPSAWGPMETRIPDSDDDTHL